VWTSSSTCSQEEIWRTRGLCLTISSVSESGPQWRAMCTMQPIAVCDMQSKDTKVQCIMWRDFNEPMQKNGMEKPNFKGFMADSAQANWNTVRIVYGSGDPRSP
jgi:hypothetical protein